jgi:hypothetical protein
VAIGAGALGAIRAPLLSAGVVVEDSPLLPRAFQLGPLGSRMERRRGRSICDADGRVKCAARAVRYGSESEIGIALRFITIDPVGVPDTLEGEGFSGDREGVEAVGFRRRRHEARISVLPRMTTRCHTR